MLDLDGGLLTWLTDKHGLTPDYVKDEVRRYMGKGKEDRVRYSGLQPTPRAAVVLSLAYDRAKLEGRSEPDERDLLLAMLEEGESIPCRLLKRLGVDLRTLSEQARAETSMGSARTSPLRLDFSPDFDPMYALSQDEVFILRRMFTGYAILRVERRLTGGYSGALVLLVTPIHADRREDASVVVKIADTTSILDEERRYKTYVRNTLPPLTARLEQRTTAKYLDIAGLKYTFVADQTGESGSLRVLAHEMGAERLREWLRNQLFTYFSRTWWMQRTPSLFQVWEEYDWLLPPLLTIDFVPEDEADAAQPRATVEIDKHLQRSQVENLEYGILVKIKNFVVEKLIRNKNQLMLALGTTNTESTYRACRILVRGADLNASGHHRREMIDSLHGRVWKTRRDSLFEAVSALDPDFDPRGSSIPFQANESLMNPILTYNLLLERQINGAISHIHGDLHLGNILIGPGDIPFLIDFEHTRRGHTAFDWASLEISIWAELAVPLVEPTWEGARALGTWMLALLQNRPLPDAPLGQALSVVKAVRDIAGLCLRDARKWDEYYAALSICALRAITWEKTMGLTARRAIFLLAALSQSVLLETGKQGGGSSASTFEDGETDLKPSDGR
ncbi:MAG: hypothetical protein CUN53_09515 [Phototrophicales bacterium]|nr:MAG: hypothetical protein CUN53_09515 [Phototrophicales bacterium]